MKQEKSNSNMYMESGSEEVTAATGNQVLTPVSGVVSPGLHTVIGTSRQSGSTTMFPYPWSHLSIPPPVVPRSLPRSNTSLANQPVISEKSQREPARKACGHDVVPGPLRTVDTRQLSEDGITSL